MSWLSRLLLRWRLGRVFRRRGYRVVSPGVWEAPTLVNDSRILVAGRPELSLPQGSKPGGQVTLTASLRDGENTRTNFVTIAGTISEETLIRLEERVERILREELPFDKILVPI